MTFDDEQLHRIAVMVVRHIVMNHECATGKEAYWDESLEHILTECGGCEFVADSDPAKWLTVARAIRNDIVYLMEEEVLPL